MEEHALLFVFCALRTPQEGFGSGTERIPLGSCILLANNAK
jgi:hypothetical protein